MIEKVETVLFIRTTGRFRRLRRMKEVAGRESGFVTVQQIIRRHGEASAYKVPPPERSPTGGAR